jgi:2-phosphoglycerate kinase
VAAPKVILIGGAPMTGKSTVARMLAGQLNYGCISTDDIGQAIEAVTTQVSHPALHRLAGQDFREYYVTRSVEELVADAELRHAALWPALKRVILAHAEWGTPIVMEGWALQPDKVAQLPAGNVSSIWLIAGDGLLEQRVRQDEFWRGASDEQAMIRHFAARSLHFNDRIRAETSRLGLPAVFVSTDDAVVHLTGRCLQAITATGP